MSNTVYKAQIGAQQKFLSSTADIVFYGGAAGGGKTYGLLLDVVSWANLPEFHGVIFRRKSTDLIKPGGIWTESKRMFSDCGGKANNVQLSWTFKHTGKNDYIKYRNKETGEIIKFDAKNKNVDIKFAGLQYDETVKDWQGTQMDYIGFDEVTHFSSYQFWYLVSRLRSTSGNIRPYIRATCNPEPNWVLDLIDWWISPDGFAIKERSGVIRWIARCGDDIVWFDDREEACKYLRSIGEPPENAPISFTFIPSTIEDNPELIRKNPNYVASLHALPEEEKQRLLMGNWRIVPSGKLFKIEWFQFYNVTPDFETKIITVDTAQETGNANDYTVAQVWGLSKNRIFLIKQFRGKVEYTEQFEVISNMCIANGVKKIYIEKKSNGHALIQGLRRRLADLGYPIGVVDVPRYKDKYTRARECSEYIQHGFVYLNKYADYYMDLVSEVVQFAPENKNKRKIHDDQVDCMMDAIEILLRNNKKDDTVISQDNRVKNYAKLQQRGAITFKGY